MVRALFDAVGCNQDPARCGHEGTPGPNAPAGHKTSDGQAVSFDDDPMSGITGNPVGAQLWGFHPPKRCDLMRPRVTFVPELLKAVEKM